MTRVAIYVDDARRALADLPDESVHTIVTSPSYFGLRDYNVEGQIGLESTPEEYVEALVAVFHDARRVLRRDGTLWLNLGDTHIGARCGGQGPSGCLAGRAVAKARANVTPEKKAAGLRRKELLLLPARVALALQRDGWRLRSDVVWHKESAVPESVTDRPSRCHESVFLFSRSRHYYYDPLAVREAYADDRHGHSGATKDREEPPGRARGDGFKRPGPWKPAEGVDGRGLRSVWSIPPQPANLGPILRELGLDEDEGHFATMAPALAERCVLLTSSHGGACARCRAPLRRVLTKTGTCSCGEPFVLTSDRIKVRHTECMSRPGKHKPRVERITTADWRPRCTCDTTARVPCVVLDPFGGAGTTGLVAARMGRDALLVELNPTYARIAERRITNDMPLLTRVRVVHPLEVA